MLKLEHTRMDSSSSVVLRSGEFPTACNSTALDELADETNKEIVALIRLVQIQQVQLMAMAKAFAEQAMASMEAAVHSFSVNPQLIKWRKRKGLGSSSRR